MSKVIWTLQSSFYQSLRQIPGFSFFLEKENLAIQSLLQTLPYKSFKCALDIGVGRGNSISLLPEGIPIKIAADYCFDMVCQTQHQFPQVHFLTAKVQLLLSNISDLLTPCGYAIFTISPKHLFTFLRCFLGHRIYRRSESEIETQFRDSHFNILEKTKTPLQI